jgi:hypothetical protein
MRNDRAAIIALHRTVPDMTSRLKAPERADRNVAVRIGSSVAAMK